VSNHLLQVINKQSFPISISTLGSKEVVEILSFLGEFVLLDITFIDVIDTLLGKSFNSMEDVVVLTVNVSND